MDNIRQYEYTKAQEAVIPDITATIEMLTKAMNEHKNPEDNKQKEDTDSSLSGLLAAVGILGILAAAARKSGGKKK